MNDDSVNEHFAKRTLFPNTSRHVEQSYGFTITAHVFRRNRDGMCYQFLIQRRGGEGTRIEVTIKHIKNYQALIGPSIATGHYRAAISKRGHLNNTKYHG